MDPTDGDGRTMRERKLAGEPYIADDPEIEAAARRARLLMDDFNATAADDSSRRHELLTAPLGALGDHTVIRPPLVGRLQPTAHASRGASFRRLWAGVGTSR